MFIKNLDTKYRDRTEYYRAIACIRNERINQIKKFGTQNHEYYKWLAILLEEIGEASKEILEDNIENYCKELIQIASVSVAMLECLFRNEPQLYKPMELKNLEENK